MAAMGMCYCVTTFLFLMSLISNGAGIRNDLKVRTKRAFHEIKPHISRDGRQCHDFCAMMSHMCRNGGTCVIDEETCVGRCECSPGWTGKRCKDRAPPDPGDKQSKPLTVSPSVSHLSELNEDVLEKRDIGTTTDSVGTETMTKVTDTIQLQQTTEAYTVDQQSNQRQNSASISNEVSAGRNLCQKNCLNGDCFHIYDEYVCKPRINSSDSGAIKVCSPGFECEHGICDLDALKNNSFKCECDRNYIGEFCTLKCPLSCGEFGVCDYHKPDNTYLCFCDWNHTGVNCTELYVKKDDVVREVSFVVPHWYVVGIPVAIVILVLSAMFLAAYFMWRRRLVFMLKIVHYFQQYEDDDGKEFDAFISYKSSPEDEAFVLQQLYPKLEAQLNFKLCLHFRDFVPGEAIANNIVRAVENSRRTIMVLSPSYVKSEWCRMEYQKAQHEMLKLKHKIIPIVLEDLSELTNIDKNLKSILNSVTYIEWPGSENSKRLDKFWKKLELSMPKRSSNSHSYPENDSDQLYSNSSSSSDDKMSKTSETETSSTSSRIRKSKRKDLKHFMGKLVQIKLFNRQNSNSSQAALVEEDTAASRSSYDSMSESIFTESSESACSTPVTAHSHLGKVDENQETLNIFFSDKSRRVPPSKENMLQLCEKDHCEGSDCTTCLQLQKYAFMRQDSNGQYINRGFSPDQDMVHTPACRYCQRSDYNRVRISALEGDKLKIQRLEVDQELCIYCHHPLNRQNPYRGSMKEHKEAANRELLKRSRVGSLPKNYKRTTELVRKELTSEQENSDSLGQFYIDMCEDV